MKRKNGQAISEYLILVALIAVGSIAVIQVLGVNIRTRLAIISEALRGKKANLQGTATPEATYHMQDLGDFQGSMQNGSNSEGQ